FTYEAFLSAATNSSLRMEERPAIFLERAFSIKLALVSCSSESLREMPFLVATARLAESFRERDLSLLLLCVPDPERSPPPDCLLTVAQARFSASSLATPFSS